MKTIHVVEETLPRAWENAILECWKNGCNFPTEYDNKKDRNDPPSKDVCALIHVTDPMKEPRIHRAFPGGLDDLEKYRLEVVHGVRNHYMDDLDNPDCWTYTYNRRLFEYDVPGKATVNQIDACISKLKECSFTRRAIAITYQPWNDVGTDDPPCLQNLFFRVENGKLNMSIFIRSNCAYDAAFMNMWAFVELQKYVADRVGVDVGEYVHFATSFHIYGSNFDRFKGFLKTVEKRTFEERTYTTKFAIPFFIEGCDQLLNEEGMPEDKKQLIIARKKYLQSQP